MSNDMVEVDKPGDDFHRRRGSVVDCLPGNRYVVEFEEGSSRMAWQTRYVTKTFDGSNLRALITVRV